MTGYQAVMTHELVGIDAGGSLCSCGEHRRSWLDHLGEVALEALEAPGAPTRRQDPPAKQLQAERDIDRARRVLADMAAEQDALWARLERSGLSSFTDRDAWLIENRTEDQNRAAEIRWTSRIEEAARLLQAQPEKEERAAA